MSSALFQKLWKTLPVNTYLSYVWFLVSQTVRSEYLPELCLMHHSKDYEKVYLWITTWVSSCPASAESVPASILCFTRCFVFDSLQSTCLSYVDFSKTPGLQPDLSYVFPPLPFKLFFTSNNRGFSFLWSHAIVKGADPCFRHNFKSKMQVLRNKLQLQ